MISHVIAYVKKHLPKLVILENVATLWTSNRFRPALQRVIRSLQESGYRWLNLDTPLQRVWQHGLPQSRCRVVLFAVHGVMACEYKPPRLLQYHLSIDACTRGSAPRRALNEREENIVKVERNKWMQCGYNPDFTNIIVDVASSLDFSYSLLDMCPCVTATRGSAHGRAFFNTRSGKLLNLNDLLRLQGYGPGIWDYRAAGIFLPSRRLESFL